MRFCDDFKDYELIDTSGGEKLERFGDIILIRPDPQIIWNTPKKNELWKKADARYIRSSSGGGSWQFFRKLPDEWEIGYRDLKFKIKPTGFKHTGIFPEQAVNWGYMMEKVKNAGRPIKALNLFAYTGGATMALASAGASVCHVDASKGITAWARENANLSGLSDKPIRWIVDDCEKFIAREIRRGVKYDVVVMDPPSYGRGPGGEIFKLEEKIYDLLMLSKEVLSDEPLLFVLNSYTTGLGAGVMEYLLNETVNKDKKGKVSASEIGIKVKNTGLILPCGNTAMCEF